MGKSINTANPILQGLLRLTKQREFVLLLVIVIGFIVVSFITPAFMTEINMRAMSLGFSLTAMISIGMAVVLISGGFDLSVGSTYGLTGSVIALLFNRHGFPIWGAAGIGIATGTGFGFLNGFVIGRLGVNPLITTLSTMIMARGLAMFLTEGRIVTTRGVGTGFPFLGQGLIYGLPFMFVVFIVLMIVFIFIFKKSVWMRNVFYTGSSAKAAEYSGINTKKIKVSVYVLCGLIAAVCGMISLSRFGVAVPSAGDGIEITAIAACAIGGTSLQGGEGSVPGAVLGVLLLSFLSNMLVLIGTSVYLQNLVSGIILLLVVTADHYNKKRLEATTIA